MSIESTRRLLNVPLILSSRVLLQNEAGNMVPDPYWHQRVRAQLEALYSFLLHRDLLNAQFVQQAPAIDSLVITAGDLTTKGLAFWQSGAVKRWLDSYDRSPAKSLDDYKIMESALERVAKGAA